MIYIRPIVKELPLEAKLLQIETHHRCACRYQSAAEAFVALGGRPGFLLSSSDIQKALRELSNKARQAKPAVMIDVHALMSDIERAYEGGLTFTQVLSRAPRFPEVSRI